MGLRSAQNVLCCDLHDKPGRRVLTPLFTHPGKVRGGLSHHTELDEIHRYDSPNA